MPDYDLILRNGTIVDGTGDAAYVGDLAIGGDRITGVGTVAASAKTEIDVSRLAIAPGFVDVHSHDDAAVVRDPAVDFKIMQGVTTDVIGNCGAGVAPTTDAFRQFYARGLGPILGDSALTWTATSEYFTAVTSAQPSLNVTAYVPHGVLRYIAMGLERREPDERELG